MLDQKRVINNFMEMVRISSPSKKERKMADYLTKVLSDLGLEVSEDNAGKIQGGDCGNIIGFLKSNSKTKKTKKTIFLSAHMDTVVPCEAIFPKIEDDIIKTDGTSVLGGDDKAGIVAILELLRVIKEDKLEHPNLLIIFTIAEEIGLLGANSFEIEKYNVSYGIILDCSGSPGKVIVKAPSIAQGKLKITGKAAHAGIEPQKGINALVVASKAISALQLGKVDFETTANLGTINGGEAYNIVMPELEISYEARSQDKNKLDALLKETFDIFEKTCKKVGASFEHSVKIVVDGFMIDENEEVVQKVKQACENLSLPYEQIETSGASDANVYNHKNIPTLNLAIGMSKVHTVEEFISIKDLISNAKILIEFIKVYKE